MEADWHDLIMKELKTLRESQVAMRRSLEDRLDAVHETSCQAMRVNASSLQSNSAKDPAFQKCSSDATAITGNFEVTESPVRSAQSVSSFSPRMSVQSNHNLRGSLQRSCTKDVAPKYLKRWQSRHGNEDSSPPASEEPVPSPWKDEMKKVLNGFAVRSNAGGGPHGRKSLAAKMSVKSARMSSKNGKEHTCLHSVEAAMMHPLFEVVSAALILLHSLVIAAYVEAVAQNGYPAPASITVTNQVLTVVFLCEVCLKMLFPSDFWCGEEKFWNMFDFILIVMVVIELLVTLTASGMAEHKKTMKNLLKMGEVIRTLRILRILRVLRFSSALRLIVSKILNSVQTLFWVMSLLFLFAFVLATCFTQGASTYLKKDQDGTLQLDVIGVSKMESLYGSIAKSVFTLFKSVTGGAAWGPAVDSLLEINTFYASVFLIYIAFTMFAVLNTVTGIFVDAAMQTALYERDLISERQSKLEESSVAHLRELFFEMDTEETGLIVQDQFREYLRDERVKSYLKALKINTEDASQLFSLLDADNSGEILIDEFVEGCMKLKGEAKSMDMHLLMVENRRLYGAINEYFSTVAEDMAQVRELPAEIRGILAGGVLAQDLQSDEATVTAERKAGAQPHRNRGLGGTRPDAVETVADSFEAEVEEVLNSVDHPFSVVP